MITIQHIIDKIRGYAPDAEVGTVYGAYLLAAQAHDGQKRKSGEDYVQHPLAVAEILADLKMDVDTVATGLLHDVLEDHPMTKAELTAAVGPVITELVDGVTKIGKLTFRSSEEAQAENFRKMMLAMSRDVRVILVKLADRIHNMRTLDGHDNADKQAKISRETMDVYAPIANRLGLSAVKTELEDLSFRYLDPPAFDRILTWLDHTAIDREAYIERVCDLLRAELRHRKMEGNVSGRAKSITSIWRKQVKQHLDVGEVPDLLAFRVLVEREEDCYVLLGYLHAKFAPVPGRIKDYIARPKPNGYQSLHTTVVGPQGRSVEIQVRTHEMHRIAENGIAAHWKYKEGHLALSAEDVLNVSHIREAFENAHESADATDFMAAVKIAFYADEVFVFTPAGEVKGFPRGATPIDFAYAVHSGVGDTCVGAKVNGRIVSLDHELQSGEAVEILTHPQQRPRRDWLEIAKTPSAIAKIRRYLRKQEEDSAERVGQGILETELERVNSSLEKVRSEGRLEAYLKRRNAKDLTPIYVELARGHQSVSDVAAAILPEGAWFSRQDEARQSRLTGLLTRMVRRSRSPVRISGEDGLLVQYAKCCNPLPGEEVVGFITRGRGISVHKPDCAQLTKLDEDRRIPVEWDHASDTRHSASVVVYCDNKPGILSKITKVVEQARLNIERVEAQGNQGPLGVVKLQVAVRDRSELARLVSNLQRIPEVQHVERSAG